MIQTLYVLSLRSGALRGISDSLNRASNRYLDVSSYHFAKESDLFLYYRTTGMRTARRLRREGRETVCVVEEVNSHVSVCHDIMREEYERLGSPGNMEKFPDEEERLDAYAEADYILCPSEWVIRSFESKGIPRSKMIKNPYGFSLPGQGDASAVVDAIRETEVFRILFVGQIHFRKGLRFLVEAFLKLEHPRKELVVVGPTTPLTGLEQMSLPEEVRFTGILKGQELENAYRTASVFCLPSLEEGLALVMGEALSYGLPIVATDHTGADDLFEDGVEGWIVPAGDSLALLAPLQRLADDPSLREEVSERALQRASTLGGWDASGRSLVHSLAGAMEDWKRVKVQ